MSSSDEAETQEFIIEMGKPWKEGDLNAALFLAAHFKKGPAIIRALCGAGGQIDARWETVRDWLLNSVALARTDWSGRSDAERNEMLLAAGLDQSASLIMQVELPGATPLIYAAASRFSTGAGAAVDGMRRRSACCRCPRPYRAPLLRPNRAIGLVSGLF